MTDQLLNIKGPFEGILGRRHSRDDRAECFPVRQWGRDLDGASVLFCDALSSRGDVAGEDGSIDGGLRKRGGWCRR